MRSRLLNGFRAIDLTTEIGYDCGRMLASLGVEVIRVDPDPKGQIPIDEANDEQRQIAWSIGSIDKRCIALDIGSPPGKSNLLGLVVNADFVIESFAPGYLDSLGLGYEALSRINPRLVMTSITAFGQKGPYASYAGGELVASAMSGVMSLCGDPDLAPVKEALNANCFHASSAALTGMVIAHYEREKSGLGQHVDVSIQECGVTRNTTGLLAYQFDKRLTKRRGTSLQFGKATVRYVWTLLDGYGIHALVSGKMGATANRALSKWMDDLGHPNPMQGIDWDRYDRTTHDPVERQKWEIAIDAFFSQRTKQDLLTEGVARGINATVISEPLEAYQHLQLRAREHVVEARYRGQSVQLPRSFLRTGHDDDSDLRIPERIGQDTAAVMSDLGLDATGVVPMPAVGVAGQAGPPLAGVKVLDFSWVIVGGMLTKQLADHGATVVKVETLHRLCGTRVEGHTSNSVRGNPDDKPWFAHINTSKSSIRLDLKNPAAREVLDRLIDWADMVVENFSPGTMEKMGLGYAHLKARKPSIVMVSGSVFGQTGPFSTEWGIDSTGAALSGRISMTGWPSRAPVVPGVVYGDALLPMLLAAAGVAALDFRDRTGLGSHIDGAMFEVQTQQMLIAALDQQVTRRSPRRTGNRDELAAPHGVFPCAGSDRWIAIDARRQDQWTLLCAVLDLSELVTDVRFLTVADRKRHEDELERLVSERTSVWDPHELMTRLQAEGVGAGAVQDASDLLERDPQLREREFLVEVDHPVLGRFAQQTTPYKFSRTKARPGPAPCLGQHTHEVCLMLGYAEDEYQRLDEAKAFV